MLEAAAQAAVPPRLLASLAAGAAARSHAASEGKAGAEAVSRARGRPRDAPPRALSQGRLALVATLRAAAAWRRLRQTQSDDVRRVIVRPEDFRIVRYRQRRVATTIFVVDASGSLAMHRLAEVKAFVELLLADCYVQRDHVALIAFRGAAGEVVLPPTRSTARARRALTGLPGGGGMPIAGGLDLGFDLGRREPPQRPNAADRADDRTAAPVSVWMARQEQPQAVRDAFGAARRIRFRKNRRVGDRQRGFLPRRGAGARARGGDGRPPTWGCRSPTRRCVNAAVRQARPS